MISIKRINTETVAPVKFIDVVEDPRPVRGADIFEEIYCNAYICARKKSGKSCSIYHIIDKCSTAETRVIAFVSTLHRDPTWRAIEDLCKRRKMEFTGYLSIKDERTREDILDSIINALDVENDNRLTAPKSTGKQAGRGILLDEDELPSTRKSKRPKEKAPKIIFIFDDISGELQSPSVTKLLKKNRHYLSKVIISSQYFNDIALQARKQLDYVLLYQGLAQSLDKLKDIYKNCDLSVKFETFVNLYRVATAEKYCFLYIDTRNSEFRKCFTHRLDVDESAIQELEEEQERIL